jgi:hypothetical protein
MHTTYIPGSKWLEVKEKLRSAGYRQWPKGQLAR